MSVKFNLKKQFEIIKKNINKGVFNYEFTV